jgi:hypothetical protein
MFTMLSSMFPQYEWLPWKFTHCPPNFWNNVDNQKKFIEWAGKQLNCNEMSDWYKVSQKVKLSFM